MLIIGIENCNNCTTLHNQHPNTPYIILPQNSSGNHQIQNIKKRLHILGVKEFPVVVNDGITKIIRL
jgi:hypothetical protein